LLEETYEALEALDEEDSRALMEELGDLLIQVVLHAQIATEEGEFNMAEVLHHVHAKLVHRHPHVFGEVQVAGADEVKANWEQLKVDERRARGNRAPSALDGVARALPSLSQADAYQKRAARVGFDWHGVEGVIEKVEEEFEEVRAAYDAKSREDEIGDLLFSVVNLARWYDLDAETTLRRANQRFRQRFQRMEAQLQEHGRSLRGLSLDEMNGLWEAAKGDQGSLQSP
jgi:MazG family protein